MKALEAVASIQLKLGYRKDQSDNILLELNQAMERMNGGVKLPNGGIFFPSFLQGTLNTINTVIGVETIDFANLYLGEVEESALWIFDPNAAATEGQWTELRKDSMDFIYEANPGSGRPKVYAIQGQYIRLRPVPDAIYQMRFVAYEADIPLVPNITNKWLTYAPGLLIAEAGRHMATGLRDQGALAFYQAEYNAESLRLFARTEDRQHVNRRYSMGGED